MTVYRTDYQPFPYSIPNVSLVFDLDRVATRVTSVLDVVRQPGVAANTPLRLDGEDIDFVGLKIDGQVCAPQRYVVDDHALTILDLPEACQVEIVCLNHPETNTALMGLYVSGQSLFTQCEAQGFRRITYFADRPDVMSIYQVQLRANPQDFPTLLSNGNLIEETILDDGRQACRWHDPFPKPCYLFALVAGEFDLREQHVKTRSGKQVLLQIYSDLGTRDRTEWAMQSLERSLRWDETRFGLELDLDRFMIVAARDFNMGAMENKGLNIFNAAYVLADAQTATDANFQAIEAVIGHEYFHNWTGNRVTCRDWFELSLKEGLTVFRDQEFTADMLAQGLPETAAASARAVKRIDDVVMLRAAQYPEDAGPMAHPIRPESFEEISNFYTATVYEKGAEVIRMMHTLLGENTFQAGMREYFKRHDGQAVTCDDFVAALESAWKKNDANKSFDVFRHWYSQAGTPRVVALIERHGHEATLTLSQTCESVGVEKSTNLVKQPFHIPLMIGAIEPNGQPCSLALVNEHGKKEEAQTSLLLELTSETQSWRIEGLSADSVLSLNRGFTSPIELEYEYNDTELATLARHDPDSFARWQAIQVLYTRQLIHADTPDTMATRLALLVEVCQAVLGDPSLDAAYLTRLMTLPSDKYLLQQSSPMDPLSVARAKHTLECQLALALETELLGIVAQHTASSTYDPSPAAAGQRALRNTALAWLCLADTKNGKSLAVTQYTNAHNMTDRLGALRALVWHPTRDGAVQEALDDFYDRFQTDALVVDKWFATQATAPTTSISDIESLIQHPAFVYRNPNRLRALVFQFCLNNPTGFHVPDGGGYAFWADHVIRIDQANPEVAARLARALDHWTHHVQPAKDQMRAALERVGDTPGLSVNTKEIVTKALTL